MNEQLQENLATLIEQAVSGIDGAVLFTQEHLPDVVHQLLIWNGVRSGLFFILGVVMIATAIRFVLGVVKSYKEKGWARLEYAHRDDEPSIEAVLSTIGSVMIGAIGTIVFFSNLTWLKILLAPKLYLLEYAAKLAQSVS